VEAPFPTAGAGDAIVQTLYLSIDPTNRIWMSDMEQYKARKLIGRDPTWGIRLKVRKSDGHHTWTDVEVAAFEAHHPVGTKPRLALALGLHTGQRRGDIIQIGRQHIRGDTLTVRQQKTGTTLALPVRPELAEIIAATPSGNLTLLTTKSGKPYSANDFSIQFRKWCDVAGLPPECTFHGLRKTTLTRLADAWQDGAPDRRGVRPRQLEGGRALDQEGRPTAAGAGSAGRTKRVGECQKRSAGSVKPIESACRNNSAND
jgi:integrase